MMWKYGRSDYKHERHFGIRLFKIENEELVRLISGGVTFTQHSINMFLLVRKFLQGTNEQVRQSRKHELPINKT